MTNASTVPTSLGEQLRRKGLPLAPEFLLAKEEDLGGLVNTLVFPLVAKGIVPGITHKSDYGLVLTGISDVHELKNIVGQLFSRIKTLGEGHVVLQAQAPTGAELLLSARLAPGIGVLVTLGLGGALVEVMRRIAVRLSPLRPEDTMDMLDEIGVTKHLSNWRGVGELDLPALTNVVKEFDQWFANAGFREWREVELNPVIVHRRGTGCTIVDLVGLT